MSTKDSRPATTAWLAVRHKQRGATAIEMALVLPLLILSMDGIIEMSLVIYDQAIVHNAAREAVRAGMVYSTPKLQDTDITALARTYADTFLVSFGSEDSLNIQVNQTAGGGSQTPLSVTVSFTYTSFLWGSFLSAIQQPITFVATATQANE